MGGLLICEERAPWWKWALISLGSTLAAVLLVLPAALYLILQGVDLQEYLEVARPSLIWDGRIGAAWALLLVGQAAGPLLVLWGVRPVRRILQERLRPPESRVGMVGRLLLGIVLFAGFQALWERVVPPSAVAERLQLVEHLTYAIIRGGRFWPLCWFVLAAGLVIPVAEEMLFRGVALGWLRRRWGFPAAALITSVLFGLPHLAHALPATLLGLYLAYQTERDRSLWGAVLLHACNNLGALLLLSLQLTN